MSHTPLPMYATAESHLSTSSRVVLNFLLVWLDANIDEINDIDCRNTITELRQVVNSINTFVDINSCINFLRIIRHEKVFMIVSGSLGQNIMPHIHDISQLATIYIFCGDKLRHERWVKKWSKIKGVFTEILPLCIELRQDIEQCEQYSMPMSFIPTNAEISTGKLNQLDQSFMYTQLLKEILLNIDFPKKSLKNFVIFCRDQFIHNKKELNFIDKFERKYYQYTPIWWYTNDCFLHSMINRALRVMEIDIIIIMGFFIRDLHYHIQELHKKQQSDLHQIQSFIVYRGQGLSKIDFNKLLKTKGGLISFNNFISTSKKPNIALLFAHRTLIDSDSMGIVFKMTIDPSISSTPFALVDDVSFYKASEQEILFSMHTIFRIGEINQIQSDNNRLWNVELTLTSDNDQQLNALTQRMREKTQGEKGWYSLGQLLLKSGQFDKAEELYKVLLNQTSDNKEKGYIYHQLGWIKANLGNYTEAISFYEKSIIIDEKILPSYHPDLATSYDNIGLVYDQMGEYSKALLSYEKVLEIYRLTFPPDHPDLATSLINIGLIYYKLNNYSKALLSYREALEIYKKTLPSNHPSLAASYNNIGLVHDKMDDYAKALWFYEKALEIHRKTLPPNHPDLAMSHQNIGKALTKMCEYSKALLSHEKALNIFQKTLPANHSHLATCYNYIASLYNNMNEYSKALSYYEMALDICQKTLPSHHADLITLYNRIGAVYEHMNEYTKALSFYQKTL